MSTTRLSSHMLRMFGHIIVVVLLTVISQVGGIIWIGVFAFMYRKKHWTFLKKALVFFIVYIFSIVVLVPPLAKLNGRVPLSVFNQDALVPQTYMTPLLNRHYVKKRLRDQLMVVATDINRQNEALHVAYLDANFPFMDGFPLLPHRSHNDGRKVDLAFYYAKEGVVVNEKPARSGYGVFVHPRKGELDQNDACKKRGHWQYDYTKYLSLGSRKGLDFDEKWSKALINRLIDAPGTQKIFIEPHLKQRLNLHSSKIRFQGCKAVRHDDHIHWQVN